VTFALSAVKEFVPPAGVRRPYCSLLPGQGSMDRTLTVT